MAVDHPRTLIQQQMYTREKRGIFRSTEGYDTIAVSGGLDSAFVKKVLHPLCVYDAPAELASQGEKDNEAYPDALHLLHLEQGGTVLGRSVYQSADFTGLRSTFFTHHYILPTAAAKSKDDYRSWLSASFEDQYSIERGSELPQLDRLPQAAASVGQMTASGLLSRLAIGEKQFKSLLYAVLASLGGKKKVYVTLDVPIAQLSARAKELLALLYSCLPYELRNTLGFITYSKEPASRKGIHLTFVETGSLRPGDREIEKEFVFDLANDRILNVDPDALNQPFLEYVWTIIQKGEELEPFFEFADEMLAGMEKEKALTASTYHELCVMYRISQGEEGLFEEHQAAVLGGSLAYLSTPGAMEGKEPLNDLMLSRFDLEYDKVMRGAVPSLSTVTIFKEYYGLAGKFMEGKLVAYLILAISNANKNGDQDTAASIYAAIEGDVSLGKAFFTKITADSRLAERLFFPYLKKKLIATPLKNVLESLLQWGTAFPKLYEIDEFYAAAAESMNAKLAKDRHSFSHAASLFEGLFQLESLSKQSQGTAAKGMAKLGKQLELTLYQSILLGFEPDRLTRDVLKQAVFLKDADRVEGWNDSLKDPKQASSARMLGALYQWFGLPKPGDSIWEGLSSGEAERVQTIARRLLSEGVTESDFPRLVFAFLQGSDKDMVDDNGLIDFLHAHCRERETIYRFFIWSESQSYFKKPRGLVPAYRTAVIRYFTSYDPSALKKRSNWKEHFDGAGEKMKAVFEEARAEVSSPLVRLLRRNRKGTTIVSIAGLGVVLIAAGLVFALSGNGGSGGKKAGMPDVSPTVTPSPSTGPGIVPEPDMLVYVEQTEAAEGVAASTSLVYLFNNADACSLFKPDKLTVQIPQADLATYTNLKISQSCTIDPERSSSSTNSAASDESNAQGQASANEIAASSSANTEEAPSTALSSATPEQSGFAATPTPPVGGSGASTELAERDESYPYRVIVQLDKPMDIPVGSLIRVGDEEVALKVQPAAGA
ncbi:hypothetical protein ACFQZE_00850 [Paenibacillus sp. GCM10027627]|uniref:GAP1-N2 domain-containing protein n=1 Tax=unclassified Paenibacillus TaxID=185978 RepID=UPI0036418A2B